MSKSKFQRLLSLKLSSLKFGAKWRIKVSNLLFETCKNTRDVTPSKLFKIGQSVVGQIQFGQVLQVTKVSDFIESVSREVENAQIRFGLSDNS